MKNIGYVGLGKMGLNMVSRLLKKDYQVVVYDPSEEVRKKADTLGAVSVASLEELAKKLVAPRTVWLMVPHQVVDAVLQELVPFLEAGDTIIDGGNSPYKESMRRAKELGWHGLSFVDVGVSGGPQGAADGACLMIGGERSVYKKYEDLWQDIATENGYGYMGVSGAGHFVKMVHNGIEYGMMQALGEGFEVLKKSNFQLDLQEVARVYNKQSVITSRLTEWLENAFTQYGTNLTDISGSIAQSGEGLWTLDAARELGVPVPIIEGAVDFRKQSEHHPSFTGKIVSALRNQFGGHEVTNK